MAEIRISKLAKQFSIGVQTLVDFLNEKGAGLGTDPNAKISDEYLPAIEAKFGEDLKLKKDAENVVIKLKDIVERGAKKKNEQEEEEEIVEKEIVIKTNALNSEAAPAVEKKPEPEPVPAKPAAPVVEKPVAEKVEESKPEKKQEEGGLKILGKIDLDKPAKPSTPEKPAEKPVVEPDPVKQESAEAEAPAKTPAAEAPKEEKPAAAVKEEPKPEVHPEPREIKVQVEKLQGPKVVDKIDLSQFDKKKKKRERIEKGGREKVDVSKVDASGNPKKDKNKGGKDQKFSGKGAEQQASGKNNKKSRRDRGGEKFKPAMTEAEAEEMQKEIQKQIKETYARMNEGKSKNNFGAKHRKEKRELASQRMQEEMELQQMEQKVLKVTEFVTVNDLATLMNNTPVTKVIAACMSLGMMVSINQRLDAETLVLVAEEFGYEVEFVTANLTEAINQSEEDADDRLESRPPVITVMGHVDHGKTSLLDYIRKANVIAGEAGGITQHIGAYNVELSDGRHITFLDTPGHEAFTAMRARGAKMTDLAIIIIAADDAIMPQTIEAINHAQAAGVPMVFAINKIDKPGANPERIREQLANMNILVEDWGGKYQCQEISAKKGINVDKLLEKVLLEADLLELKANPYRRASGAVIESSLDKGRGYLATILVQNGTLHVGDIMLSGCKKWDQYKEDMINHGVPDWYIWSCQKIQYMFPKAHAVAYVMMGWRIAYYKINYPLAYYAAYFSIRADAFNYEKMCRGANTLHYYLDDLRNRKDSLSPKEQAELKDMRIVEEMYARGFEFLPLDIFRADPKSCTIIEGKIMPHIGSIDGMGLVAAEGIANACKEGPFISRDDFRERSKVSKTITDKMYELGLLGDLPESNQISLNDYFGEF